MPAALPPLGLAVGILVGVRSLPIITTFISLALFIGALSLTRGALHCWQWGYLLLQKSATTHDRQQVRACGQEVVSTGSSDTSYNPITFGPSRAILHLETTNPSPPIGWPLHLPC